MLPKGHRLHVVLEGISRGFSAVNIRKFVLRAARLSDLVELGSLTARAAAFLERYWCELDSTPGGRWHPDGKTTLLNCLAAAIQAAIEWCRGGVRAAVAFPSRLGAHADAPGRPRGTGEIRLRDLVKEALRMRPSRIVVGEVRSEECLVLVALNAAFTGMCTLHANRPEKHCVKPARCRSWRGRTSRPGSWCRPWHRRWTWSCISDSMRTAYAG